MLALLNPAAAAVAGIASDAAAPDLPPAVASIQTAYEAARDRATEAHADDLQVRSAKCSVLRSAAASAAPTGDDGASHPYACQIDFIRQSETHGRLYFDVVTLQQRAGQWTLLSGLCLRKKETEPPP